MYFSIYYIRAKTRQNNIFKRSDFKLKNISEKLIVYLVIYIEISINTFFILKKKKCLLKNFLKKSVVLIIGSAHENELCISCTERSCQNNK